MINPARRTLYRPGQLAPPAIQSGISPVCMGTMVLRMQTLVTLLHVPSTPADRDVPLHRLLGSQDSVSEFKARLSAVLDLPANKQKLAREGVGFLRDELSLAHYNVAPDVVLTLGLKERGGARKK